MTEQRLDHIVRDVLEDLAGESRPAQLLGGTVRRARRIRRRRAALTTGAAVLPVLAVLVAPALAGGRADTPSRPSPTPTRTGDAAPVPVLTITPAPARVDLPDGFTVTAIGAPSGGASAEPPLWIYSRATGSFVATPYAYASLAPSGTRAIVQARAATLAPWLIDLRDLTARPWPKLDNVSGQMWSQDARTLLDGSATPGWLHLLDADTGERRDVLFNAPQVGCDRTIGCGPVWFRGGAEATVAVFDPSTGEQTGVHVISAETGTLIRSLPVKGYVAGACSWSTDARYVLTEMRPENGDSWLEITEAATGRRKARLPAMANANPDSACWTSPTRLLVVDGGHVKVFTPDGTVEQDITVPGAAWLTVGPR
ncbi:hypothetical protein OHA72_51630 [Dactylosporangium sp. NBC_01737]|uniref:hypothetical protein n=1 Tax=Dactylosporangium sp. NBC_01737 TaxID=2975959 RepID=UPI002E15A830|nr:hypothetical protein OHA72_51630 [Dactylosporangium sp. NBC_01737]